MSLKDRKCPICGHPETRVFGVFGDQRMCELCGTTDATARFPVIDDAEKFVPHTGMEEVLRVPYAQQIIEPIERERVRELASLIGYDLVPRVITGSELEVIAKNVAIIYGPAWHICDAEQKRTAEEVVKAVARMLPRITEKRD